MLFNCLKFKNPKVVKAKNQGIMVLSNCTVCGSKKSIFIKEQEATIPDRIFETKERNPVAMDRTSNVYLFVCVF